MPNLALRNKSTTTKNKLSVQQIITWATGKDKKVRQEQTDTNAGNKTKIVSYTKIIKNTKYYN